MSFPHAGVRKYVYCDELPTAYPCSRHETMNNDCAMCLANTDFVRSNARQILKHVTGCEHETVTETSKP